jgi:hypothetical protein
MGLSIFECYLELQMDWYDYMKIPPCPLQQHTLDEKYAVNGHPYLESCDFFMND